VPGDATVVLCGWCALILSGGRVNAVRHRVRRLLGVRRLSAGFFVAPDVDAVLKPLKVDETSMDFSEKIMTSQVNVGWFKDVMGKRWRWRGGNEVLKDGEREEISQDEDIDRFVWGKNA
jgi:isopenicillin N synthase-like dioxygenase